MKLLFILFLTVLVQACNWHKEHKPSVLVVAVDSLAFDHSICSPSRSAAALSGIQILCDESVRFTHAYTPSVLAQPALASLLTARYPHEHGVWHNGPKFLSAKFTTSAEYAVESGFQTAFFSGGAPIWSFSGLNQGFELFSDQISIRPDLIYRPVEENFERLLTWIDRGEKKRPFFAVVYLADLQFKDVETINRLGEVRPKTYESQFQEIDESLGHLIEQLKKRDLWNSTHFVLTGLNGVSNPQKPEELKGVNLFSSNSEVALYIKPAGKKRDLGLQWKIDKNVSLVDVGATLFTMIGREPPAVAGRTLDVVSLDSVLSEPTAAWDKNRLILMESAWAQWRSAGNSRFAMRAGHLLFVHDTVPAVFNTFVDHMETVPISWKDPQVVSRAREVAEYMTEHGFEPWSSVNPELIEKWRIGSEIWQDKSPSQEVMLALRGLYERRSWDQQISGWLVSLALRRGDWVEIGLLAEKTKNTVWTYFADRALGKTTISPDEGCLSLMNQIDKPLSKPSPKICSQSSFVSLLMWLSRVKDVQNRDRYRARFLRRYRVLLTDQRIYEANMRNQLLWNVDINLPAGPDITELTLSLPEFMEQKNKALADLNIE